MVDTSVLWGFALITALIVIAPGSDTMLLLRATLAGGMRIGLTTLAAINTGNVILTTLVACGVGAFVSTLPWFMLAVQLIGGAYLLWIAWGCLKAFLAALRSRRGGSQGREDAVGVASVPLPLQKAFAQGLITNMTNPKLLVFYVSFLPQFLGSASNPFAQLELLAWTFIAMSVLWELMLVLLAVRMQRLMTTPAFALTLEAVSAATFALLGGGVLFEALHTLAGH